MAVILASWAPRRIASVAGSELPRYRTVAELASAEYFNEDVVYDEVITTVGDNNDYIFKTGATQTIISRNSRTETITYTVKTGESVNSVAADFGLSPET
ncbi:MAG: hypothetical protein V1826_03200, partial [bacterium]